MKKTYFISGLIVIFLLILGRGVHSVESERGVEIKGTGQPSDITIEGDYWALIIGINEYPNFPQDKQLEAARYDAQAVADILQKKYGFAKERMIELYDKDATRSAIYKQLGILARTLTNKDNLLIYFAGHGEYDKDTQIGWWLPSDAQLDDAATYVSNSDVKDYLKGIKARHIYTIADSCFSESLMGTKSRSLGQDRAIKELYNDKSRWILTSGGLYPVPDKGKGNHSTFAYYFLRILERNEDQFLTPLKIISELQPSVSNESNQTPKSLPIAGIGDEGGQFVFVLAYAKAPTPEYIKDKESDIRMKEERKKMEEQKARLEEDMRKFKEKQMEVEREQRELREKTEEMEKEKKAQQQKLEEEKWRLENEKKAHQQKIDEDKWRLEQQQKELEEKKKKEKPVFMPPSF